VNNDPGLRSKDRSPTDSGLRRGRRLYKLARLKDLALCGLLGPGHAVGKRSNVKRTAKVLTALVAINCNLAVGFTAPANAVPITTSSAPISLSLSTPSVMKLLAGEGIVTVANEQTTAPLVPVGKPVGLQFTQAQVASLATAAANEDGITGAALDATVPVGKGAPPFGYLLAAWASTGTSKGAATVRAIMGPENWGQAPDLVFPTVALPLFAADVVAAVGAQTTRTSAAVDGADDPALGRGPGRTAMGLFTSPCTTVTNFIQETLDKLFEVLKLGTPSGSSVVAKVGSFFVTLWNVAVSLAQTVVNGLIKYSATLFSTVVDIAGDAFALAELVSNLVPWSARVTAVPPSVALGGNTGSFKAVIGGGGITYPSYVEDCAKGLGLQLPSFSAKGSKATWTVTGPITPTSTTTPVLDSQGSNTLSYTTGLVPCVSALPADEQKAHATISLTRSAIGPLKTLLTDLVARLTGQVGTYLKPIIGGLMGDVAGKLSPLAQVSATGTVMLTKPTAGDKSQTSCPCVLGKWEVRNETVALAHLSGGAGTTWVLTPDGDNPAEGTTEVDYDGSQPLANSEMGLTVQYSGSEEDSFSIPPADLGASSGTWTVRAISGHVVATTNVGGQSKTAPLPFEPGVAFSGTWTCEGDDMDASYAGVGEVVSLTRVSSYAP
jgi:hypothetical protein